MPFRPTSFPSLPGIQRTFLLGLLLLLVPAMAAWSKPADTIRAITGDCLGGADVTVTDESWGLDDSFHCGAAGTLTFGGNISIGEGADVSLSAGTVRIVPPVTIGQGATFRADTAITGSNRAMLGPLAGASIKAYLLTDLNNPIETTTAADLPAGMDVAGRFHLSLGGVPADEWVLVSASGGKDIDFNDDGALDAAPTANQGTLYALAKASDWRSGGVILSALSDMAWRYTENLVNQVAPDELHKRLDSLAQYLIGEDLNGDGEINSADLIAFVPNNTQHQAKLSFNYANLFAQDSNNNSLITALHGTDGEEIANQLDRLFGHTLSRHTAADARYTQINIEAALFGKGKVASGDGKIQLDVDNPDQDVPSAWYSQDFGKTLMFTAVPAEDNHIIGWTGCDSVNMDLSQCTVTLAKARTVVASFAYNTTELKANLHDLTGANLIVGDTTINVSIPSVNTGLTSDLLNLQVNDFIVGPSDQGGFLRKVISFSRIDDFNYNLVAEDASLADIISQGTGQIDKPLTNGDLAGYTPPTLRSSAQVSSEAFTGLKGVELIPSANPDDRTFRIKIGSNSGTRAINGDLSGDLELADGVTLSGYLEMEIDVEAGVSIGWTGLEYFKFVPHIRSTQGIALTATKGASFDKISEIGRFRFNRIKFTIGPVPVWITPEVVLEIGASGTLQAELTMGMELEQDLYGGIVYRDGQGVSIVKGFDFSTNPTYPTIEFEAESNLFLRATPGLKLYDAVGPEFPFTASIKASAFQSFYNPRCVGGIDATVRAALNGKANFSLSFEDSGKLGKILSWSIGASVEKEFDLFNPEEWVLKEWNIGGLCDEAPPKLIVEGMGIKETITEGQGGILSTQLTLRNDGQATWIDYMVQTDFDDILKITGDSGELVVSLIADSLAPGETRTLNFEVDTSTLTHGIYWNYFYISTVDEHWDPNLNSPVINGDKSFIINVLPDRALLPKPTITSAVSNAGGAADLTWTHDSASSSYPLLGYQFYIKSASETNSEWQLLESTSDIADRSHTIQGLPENSTVEISMDAWGDQGVHTLLSNSVVVDVQGGLLSAPQLTTASSLTKGSAMLSWTFDPNSAPVPLNGYRVIASTSSSPNHWMLMQTLADITLSTTTIDKLNEGETYYFRIAATGDDSITTPWSNAMTAKIRGETTSPVGGVLNDTGQTWGGNYSSGNNATCTSNIAAPQDCHQGRDALAEAGQLQKAGTGSAGFDFTKLDASGNPLHKDATSWSCVRDNHTGLMWEVKASAGNGTKGDEGLHDADDRFNWYDTNPATNGGADGYADDDGAICHGYNATDATSYCNTQAFAARVNQAGRCGYNDWRLPNREELRSIVDYGRYSPAIDADYFPDSQSAWFWSSSAYAGSSSYAWFVDFGYGYGYYGHRSSTYAVRLVRGGQ